MVNWTGIFFSKFTCILFPYCLESIEAMRCSSTSGKHRCKLRHTRHCRWMCATEADKLWLEHYLTWWILVKQLRFGALFIHLILLQHRGSILNAVNPFHLLSWHNRVKATISKKYWLFLSLFYFLFSILSSRFCQQNIGLTGAKTWLLQPLAC